MGTVKSGYLQQLSGFLKRDWKKRYFVLYQNGELVYYEAEEEHSSGRLNIGLDCERIDYGYEVKRDTKKKTSVSVHCLFSIRTTQKSVYLLADTEEDARDWVKKFNGIHQKESFKVAREKEKEKKKMQGRAGGYFSGGGSGVGGFSGGGFGGDGGGGGC